MVPTIYWSSTTRKWITKAGGARIGIAMCAFLAWLMVDSNSAPKVADPEDLSVRVNVKMADGYISKHEF